MQGCEKIVHIDRALSVLEPMLQACCLCPRMCKVDRNSSAGFCRQSVLPRVSSALLHFGEEPPLVKSGGSGTVFFSGCSMRCVYCQNFAISQKNNGRDISAASLSDVFLALQDDGAENINLVTPTAHLPGILRALRVSFKEGLGIPIVYNTSSYERPEIIEQLEGIVDIYLADIRYTDDDKGESYSGVRGYWTVASSAIKEMHRQVGAFKEGRHDGSRGLIIRHLVLPNGISGTEQMAEFIAYELSSSVPVSLMSQYRPVFNARHFPEISKRITDEEYKQALVQLEIYNIIGWFQHFSGFEEDRVKPIRRQG